MTASGTKPGNIVALAVFLLAACGCATRIVDIRPYAVHPDQTMEDENVLVSEQHRIRTRVRYMQPSALDDAFRPSGVNSPSANPFLYRPPYAPIKYTVFHVTIRNDGEHDAFGEWDKFLLRDDEGNEFRPIPQDKLTNYWMGQVTMRLGDPITWVPQMNALKAREEKEKTRVETIYTGGMIPPRGEHSGYIVFKGINESGKPRLPWHQKTWWRMLEFAAPVPAGYTLVNETQHPLLRAAGGILLGGIALYVCDYFWGPPKAIPIGHLQLILEVTGRASRYGNPASLALSEINFNMVKVQLPAEGMDDMEEWRTEE